MLNFKLSENNRTCNIRSPAFLKASKTNTFYHSSKPEKNHCWFTWDMNAEGAIINATWIQPKSQYKQKWWEGIQSSSNTVLWDHSEGHSGKRRTFVSVLENWTISILQAVCVSIYKCCASGSCTATVLVLFQKCIKMDIWDIINSPQEQWTCTWVVSMILLDHLGTKCIS